MKHAQDLLTKTNNFKPYALGQRVWLEATNLKTTHPTAKLRAKQYGPFMITRAISHVTYQLDLPPQWKIHNVFHCYAAAGIDFVCIERPLDTLRDSIGRPFNCRRQFPLSYE